MFEGLRKSLGARREQITRQNINWQQVKSTKVRVSASPWWSHLRVNELLFLQNVREWSEHNGSLSFNQWPFLNKHRKAYKVDWSKALSLSQANNSLLLVLNYYFPIILPELIVLRNYIRDGFNVFTNSSYCHWGFIITAQVRNETCPYLHLRVFS